MFSLPGARHVSVVVVATARATVDGSIRNRPVS
jgi:hypothetical protein